MVLRIEVQAFCPMSNRFPLRRLPRDHQGRPLRLSIVLHLLRLPQKAPILFLQK